MRKFAYVGDLMSTGGNSSNEMGVCCTLVVRSNCVKFE